MGQSNSLCLRYPGLHKTGTVFAGAGELAEHAAVWEREHGVRLEPESGDDPGPDATGLQAGARGECGHAGESQSYSPARPHVGISGGDDFAGFPLEKQHGRRGQGIAHCPQARLRHAAGGPAEGATHHGREFLHVCNSRKQAHSSGRRGAGGVLGGTVGWRGWPPRGGGDLCRPRSRLHAGTPNSRWWRQHLLCRARTADLRTFEPFLHEVTHC